MANPRNEILNLARVFGLTARFRGDELRLKTERRTELTRDDQVLFDVKTMFNELARQGLVHGNSRDLLGPPIPYGEERIVPLADGFNMIIMGGEGIAKVTVDPTKLGSPSEVWDRLSESVHFGFNPGNPAIYPH